jgi:hypothetical protein
MTVPSMRRRLPGRGHLASRMLLGVVALLTCAWSYAIPAQALPVPQTASCAGVWVVVDYGAVGGTATACAGSYSTGTAALRSAGFALTLDAGLIVRINGLPTTPNTQENYWSYWHATRQPDGSYSGWSYSSVGPSSYHPVAGGAEGWRYQPVNAGYVAPGVAPPKQTATTEAPTTTAPAPATTAKTTMRAATTTGAVSQATTAAAVTGSSATDPTSTQPSATGVETPVLSAAPSDSTLVVAPRATGAPISTSISSLVGGVIAICVIAVAAAAMLIWRKRVAAKG